MQLNFNLTSIDLSSVDIYSNIFIILLFFILIAFYGLFVFFYYRFLAKRDIFELNLAKYNIYNNKGVRVFFTIILFIIEYIFLMPIFVLFWFSILAIFILVLSQELNINQILLISASLVGAVRITAYINEDLSRDLAKLFPFTLLAVFLLNPNFFNFSSLLEKVTEIPMLLNTIANYILLIFIVEIFLRLLYTVYSYATQVGKIP